MWCDVVNLWVEGLLGMMDHILVSSSPIPFVSISKSSYSCVEETPGWTTDSSAFDGYSAILGFLSFMGLMERKPYLVEFLFVSFHFYLKKIVNVCRRCPQVNDNPAFRGCGTTSRFYG